METTDKVSALKELRVLLEEKVISDDEFKKECRRVMHSARAITLSLADIIKLLSAIAWPIVALIVLATLHESIITKLTEAENFSIGSFSIKVREKARMTGNPDLAEALSGLSQRAIELLMDTGDKNMGLAAWENNEPIGIILNKLEYAELETRGLLYGPELFSSFINWAQSLPGVSSIVYQTENGSITEQRPNSTYRVIERYHFKLDQISKDDKKRLQNAQYTLSEKGKKIWRLLGKVVSEQLASPYQEIQPKKSD